MARVDERKVRAVLKEKFGVAIDNCSGGYGLDALTQGGDEGAE